MKDETKKNICWPVLLYIGGYHLFLLVALPLYFISHLPSIGMVMTMLGLVFLTEIAVTSLYHRLYSHSAYKLHPVVEAILLFFGSMATQGSAIRWSHDHRLHHAFVDKEKDPYSVKKGFWHAHILWLFKRSEEIEPKVVIDLWRKKLLQFQHRFYVLCMLFSNALVFAVCAWIFQDVWGSFLFIWILRMCIAHHMTWCINSAAHYWGSQSYSEEHSAVDNYLISLFTCGEGYHNYHHTFAQDYRNGVYWYHFDPTKWLIWILHRLGLAFDLKTVNRFRIQKALLLHHRDDLLQKLSQSLHEQKELFTQRVIEIHGKLSEKLAALQALVDKTRELPQKDWIAETRKAKAELKAEWKQWRNTVRTLSKLSVVTH